jgi:membrane-bound lytic murein transglycosylase D
LALAAYNCGPGCVDRAVQKTAYADYWELRNRHAVPIETTNYVPIILALTIIMKNPVDYGLADLELETPLDYDTIEVYSNTSLQLAADAAQVPVTTLQDMNPAVLRNIVPTGYFLRVPKNSAAEVSAALDLVPSDKRDTWRLHRLQERDTLETVARQYHVGLESMEQANPKFGNVAYAVVPQMVAKPKPTRTTAVKGKATRSAPVRVTRSKAKPTATKRAPARPSPSKPTVNQKKPVKPSPSARK